MSEMTATPEMGVTMPGATTHAPALSEASRAGEARGGIILATLTLWRREMVRFFRDPPRIIGSLLFPVIIWLLLSAGVNRAMPMQTSATGPQIEYSQYLFAGILVSILLFAAIFSTVTVIEDRKEGFLQGVLVAPIPRLAIVLGKVLGGAAIATIEAVLFLLLWPMVGHFSVLGFVEAVGTMFVLSAGLTALSLCLAWPMDSTAGFHAVMNVVLMPMWFLCGALFPLVTAKTWIQVLMYANPLTYGQAVMVSALMGPQTAKATIVAPVIAVPVMLVLCGAAIAAATYVAGGRRA